MSKRLWKQYRRSNGIEDRDALIIHYLHLVKAIVGRMVVALPSHIKMDDLYSSGVTGLIKAVTRYDHTRKVKFESYASLLIKGAIIDELRELDWIPRSIHQKANQISVAVRLLEQKLGREPTDEELSRHLGMTESAFADLLNKVRPAVLIPLNANVIDDGEGEGAPIAERIADESAKTSDLIAEKKQFHKMLSEAIEKLPHQEQKVLRLYYFDDLMLKEIGKVMGVSESRVSQIHTKALIKLRAKFSTYADEIASML